MSTNSGWFSVWEGIMFPMPTMQAFIKWLDLANKMFSISKKKLSEPPDHPSVLCSFCLRNAVFLKAALLAGSENVKDKSKPHNEENGGRKHTFVQITH